MISRRDGEQPPRAVDAFEFVLALLGEGGAATEHHVADGGRGTERAVPGLLLDAGGEVYGDAGNIAVVVDFDFAGVDSRPDLDAYGRGKYADCGETMLKGFEDAVRLYEVHWRE